MVLPLDRAVDGVSCLMRSTCGKRRLIKFIRTPLAASHSGCCVAALIALAVLIAVVFAAVIVHFCKPLLMGKCDTHVIEAIVLSFRLVVCTDALVEQSRVVVVTS